MTVTKKELVEFLSQFPDDTPVLVDRYEFMGEINLSIARQVAHPTDEEKTFGLRKGDVYVEL